MSYQRALISFPTRPASPSFAQKLHDAGVELVASGGSATQLAEAGLPVTPLRPSPVFLNFSTVVSRLCIRQYTAAFSPAALRKHLAELEQQGLLPIDLVVVNLYPFQRTVAVEGVTLAEAVEQIDIGGVALLRAAAKNFESVTVICDPSDYERVGPAIANGGPDAEIRQALALKAFRHTAHYDAAISEFLAQQALQDHLLKDSRDEMPPSIQLNLERVQVMRYGENPHQQGAFYRHSGAPPAFEQLHGQEMSYNNWLDLDGSWQAAQTSMRRLWR